MNSSKRPSADKKAVKRRSCNDADGDADGDGDIEAKRQMIRNFKIPKKMAVDSARDRF
jgi:hypothetical protein